MMKMRGPGAPVISVHHWLMAVNQIAHASEIRKRPFTQPDQRLMVITPNKIDSFHGRGIQWQYNIDNGI